VSQQVYRVLFVCSGNCGRSIMAESILTQLGGPHFEARSAGTHPTGRINPLALEELSRRGYPTQNLHSKSWDDFVRPGAAPLDLVITVCSVAAQEPQLAWPGQPVTMQWYIPSPGAVQGDESKIRTAFRDVCQQVEDAIKYHFPFPLAMPAKSAIETKPLGT
jgi:arsenate reductase